MENNKKHQQFLSLNLNAKRKGSINIAAPTPNFIVGDIPYLYEEYSLFIFSKHNKIRQTCVRIISYTYFDHFILFVIILNSFVFALADYSHVNSNNNLVDEGSVRNLIYIKSSPYFLGVFIIECVLKVIAMGFIGFRGSYISDPWNWLDLTVVVTGYVLSAVVCIYFYSN